MPTDKKWVFTDKNVLFTDICFASQLENLHLASENFYITR